MSFSYIAVTCALLCCVRSKILSVSLVPQILPHKVVGRLTSSSFVLSQPLCYFNHLTGVPCTVSTCEIWSVIASGPGVRNFDRDKVTEASKILSASPYQQAFAGPGQRRYFITKLGVPRDFPCGKLPGIRYFKVGADGNCSTPNCNGILPGGSTVRAIASIDESSWKRSGAMVVITVILSCSLAVLMVLLVLALLQGCVGSVRGRHDIDTDPASFKVRGYSTNGVYSQTPGHALRP